MPKMRADPNARRLSGKEAALILKRLFGRMFRYYTGPLILSMILILVSAAAGVLGNAFMGKLLIDVYIADLLAQTQAGLTPDYSAFSQGVLIMASIYAVGVVSSFFYKITVSMIGQGTQKKIRDELFEHMEKLPLSYFDSRRHGDIMSVYTNDIDTLREMISRVLPMVVESLVTMAAALTMMIVLCIQNPGAWVLVGVIFLFFVVILTTVLNVSKASSKFFIGQQRSLGATNGYIEEMITGQKVIKVFNHEEESKQGFDELNEKLCGYTTRASQFSNILGPITNNISNMQYVVIAFVGAAMVVTSFGAIQAGTIVSFLTIGRTFTMPLGQLAMQINMLVMAMAGAQRIFALMDAKPESYDGYVTLVNAKEDEDGNPVETKEATGRWAWKHPHTDGSGTTYVWLKGDIRLHNVDFSYVPGKTVLHDVSLYAKPGQKVAFVGPTGAGKTTITNLLNRFYDIEDGKIRFDGININKIHKLDLRRAVAVVLQDVHLFTGTVRENIRYGNLNATDEEIETAAKLANADNFIRMLPQGYDTVLENAGAGLSQGQRQLLSIARAAVANPPVLILDEATSSIDSRTEKLVQEGMDAIMKGRTVFVIAHRLSTIQNSNAILVLKNGTIIERGDHGELLEKKGEYYQLYTGGFGGKGA